MFLCYYDITVFTSGRPFVQEVYKSERHVYTEWLDTCDTVVKSNTFTPVYSTFYQFHDFTHSSTIYFNFSTPIIPDL